MTSRATLRTSLRARLEDVGAGPLWDDATLNEAIAAAVRRYGQVVRASRTLSLSLAEGATSAILPADVEDDRIVAVFDPDGNRVARHRGTVSQPGEPSPGEQAWRAWGGLLSLDLPAAGGTWRLDYRAVRSVPADDAVAVDLASGDEDLIVSLALAIALDQRIVADAKRGTANADLRDQSRMAHRAADRTLASRRRVVRGHWAG